MQSDRRHGLGLAAMLAVLTVALAACGSSVTASPAGPTETPVVTGPGPSATPGPTPVPTDAGATPGPSLPSQTDSAWGRIWDAVPDSFPRYPGASPTEIGEGPASATLDLGPSASNPAEVATFYRTTLASAGFDPVDASGPMEDGSYQVNAAGAADCAVQVTVAPLGADTVITILYGAACPFS